MDQEFKTMLIECSKRGLIIGPNENRKNFLKRIEECKKQKSCIDFTTIQKQFAICPDWIEIEYSSNGLHFWEAACVWENKIKVQLQPIFLKKNYLGYTKEELINHELVHLVREKLHSPIFEEILAYQTSKKWRKYFGPIVKNPNESKWFIFFLFAITPLSFFSPFFLSLLILPIGYAFFRLFRLQKIFLRAKQKLALIVEKKNILPILVRLTDEEITLIAKQEKEEIVRFFKLSKSMRIKQLVLHLLPSFL